MTIQHDASLVLGFLAEATRELHAGREVAEAVGISPDRVNDAVSVLQDSGYVRVVRTMGNAPFDFREVLLTPGGRAEWERAVADAQAEISPDVAVRPTPQPVGSPYGFTDLDWEWIGQERQASTLKICFGHQFDSTHYSTDTLTESLRSSFQRALDESEFAGALTPDFVSLRAGYGEHLFNDIARTIIASDIAVFETSDRNSNVMIEMGVALTWGTRVFPIREASTEVPPSDISGQTWALYRDSGATWLDTKHHESLVQMVNRAGRKKRSAAIARSSSPDTPRQGRLKVERARSGGWGFRGTYQQEKGGTLVLSLLLTNESDSALTVVDAIFRSVGGRTAILDGFQEAPTGNRVTLPTIDIGPGMAKPITVLMALTDAVTKGEALQGELVLQTSNSRVATDSLLIEIVT